METFGFTTCMGKTRLTDGKATYSARVTHKDIVRDKALIEGLAAETGYSTTIVGTVIEGMRSYLGKQLKAGKKVDFGAFSVGLSVRGAFPSANAPFDPMVNSVGVDIRAGDDGRIDCVLDEDVPLGEYWLVVGCHVPGKSDVATGRRLVQVVATLR